jgi:hypothetical protein
LLGDGTVRRPIPKHDITAIIPDAYGPAMAKELTAARSARQEKGR